MVTVIASLPKVIVFVALGTPSSEHSKGARAGKVIAIGVVVVITCTYLPSFSPFLSSSSRLYSVVPSVSYIWVLLLIMVSGPPLQCSPRDGFVARWQSSQKKLKLSVRIRGPCRHHHYHRHHQQEQQQQQQRRVHMGMWKWEIIRRRRRRR